MPEPARDGAKGESAARTQVLTPQSQAQVSGGPGRGCPSPSPHPRGARAGRSESRAASAHRSEESSTSAPLLANFHCGTSPNSLEAAIRIACSIALPHHGALILHSSAVADTRGAHIFSGVSGAGKSTIARLLCEDYPVTKLSDELLLLRKRTDGTFAVQVSPFIGSTDLPTAAERPLASINFLVQAPQHHRTRLSPAAVMAQLCKHVLTYARDPHTSQRVLDLATDIALSVPAYELRFAKRGDVGQILEIAC